MDNQVSVRAIICVAHLMMMQNPRATLDVYGWINFLVLLREWALRQEIDGVRYYLAPEFFESPPKGSMH